MDPRKALVQCVRMLTASNATLEPESVYKTTIASVRSDFLSLEGVISLIFLQSLHVQNYATVPRCQGAKVIQWSTALIREAQLEKQNKKAPELVSSYLQGVVQSVQVKAGRL